MNKMHRNRVWLLFLALVIAYTVYFTGATALEAYRYARLNQTVAIKDISWSIRSFASDAFSPQADYHYEYQGKTFSGKTIWTEKYLNDWAAAEAIHRMHPTMAWINPSDPSESTMERLFPLKSTLYMMMLWGLLAYFYFLGKKVATYWSY